MGNREWPALSLHYVELNPIIKCRKCEIEFNLPEQRCIDKLLLIHQSSQPTEAGPKHSTTPTVPPTHPATHHDSLSMPVFIWTDVPGRCCLTFKSYDSVYPVPMMMMLLCCSAGVLFWPRPLVGVCMTAFNRSQPEAFDIFRTPFTCTALVFKSE